MLAVPFDFVRTTCLKLLYLALTFCIFIEATGIFTP